MTIGKAAFCLFLYLTGVQSRSKLEHVGDVREQKIKCWANRTGEIGGVRLQNGLYDSSTKALSDLNLIYRQKFEQQTKTTYGCTVARGADGNTS